MQALKEAVNALEESREYLLCNGFYDFALSLDNMVVEVATIERYLDDLKRENSQ